MKYFLLRLKLLIFIYYTQAQSLEDSNVHGNLSFPFIVSIDHQTDKGFQHLCVGTIIHKRFVLTAAHCFESIENISVVSVVSGEKTTNNRRNAFRILQHLKYEPLFGYDIAIIEITPAFDDKEIGKLNYQNVPEVQNAYLCGWNEKKNNVELSEFESVGFYKCVYDGFQYLTNVEICAYQAKGRGGCDGDSGGPLVSSDLKKIIGILSYGKANCLPNETLVFTSIKALEPWINTEIQKLLRGDYPKNTFIYKSPFHPRTPSQNNIEHSEKRVPKRKLPFIPFDLER